MARVAWLARASEVELPALTCKWIENNPRRFTRNFSKAPFSLKPDRSLGLELQKTLHSERGRLSLLVRKHIHMALRSRPSPNAVYSAASGKRSFIFYRTFGRTFGPAFSTLNYFTATSTSMDGSDSSELPWTTVTQSSAHLE